MKALLNIFVIISLNLVVIKADEYTKNTKTMTQNTESTTRRREPYLDAECAELESNRSN